MVDHFACRAWAWPSKTGKWRASDDPRISRIAMAAANGHGGKPKVSTRNHEFLWCSALWRERPLGRRWTPNSTAVRRWLVALSTVDCHHQDSTSSPSVVCHSQNVSRFMLRAHSLGRLVHEPQLMLALAGVSSRLNVALSGSSPTARRSGSGPTAPARRWPPPGPSRSRRGPRPRPGRARAGATGPDGRAWPGCPRGGRGEPDG
jgi:hypothetical protein